MKMIYNGAPIKNLNIHTDTDSATMVASDLQAGVTAFARGQKITGTGKCFEFAQYGNLKTNLQMYVPNTINVVEIASLQYPVKSSVAFSDMANNDFSVEQTIGYVNINGSDIEIKAVVKNNLFMLICENTIELQVFWGKDNYI